MLIAYFSQTANGLLVKRLGSAEPNCSAIIIWMLMMSAEVRRHPCDLIKPNSGQSVFGCSRAPQHHHYDPSTQPLRSPCLLGLVGWACQAANSCSSSVSPPHPPCFLSDIGLAHSRGLVQNFTMIRIRNETLCLRFHFQALSACGTCSLGFSSAAIFDGMQ